ncbi:MAG: hypothetical protein ACP5GN_05910 [Fervidicoccaceae archaeon]
MEKEKESKMEAEEVKELLSAVSEFLKGLKEPLEEIMKMITESFSGEKLGREVASFYKSLIEAGLDDETAKSWTEKFMDEKLKTIPSISNFGEIIGSWMKREGENSKVSGKEEH